MANQSMNGGGILFLLKNKYGMVRSGWLILFACIIYVAMQIACSLPGVYLYRTSLFEAGSLDNLVELSQYPWIELSMNGGGVLGALLGSLLLWKFMNKGRIVDLGFAIDKLQFRDFVFGLLLGGASMALIFAVLLLTGALQLHSNLLVPEFSTYSLTFLILFLLVGFSEEIFFRGYIMRTMVDRNNPKWLIYIISAIIFSMFHGTNPNVSLFGLINIALVGLLFSYMFDITKSLWLPIGYHITWNYFQGNVFGFPVSGTNPHGLYEITLKNQAALFTGGSFGPEGGMLATILIILGAAAVKMYSKSRFRYL